jgi:hypothetical protein
MQAKFIIGHFEGIFEGGQKSRSPLKKPKIICFVSLQKIIPQTYTISCTLVIFVPLRSNSAISVTFVYLFKRAENPLLKMFLRLLTWENHRQTNDLSV